MKRTILKGATLLAFIFFTSTLTQAQPGGGGGGQGQGGQPPGGTGAPVDAGVPILLMAVGGYAYLQLKKGSGAKV